MKVIDIALDEANLRGVPRGDEGPLYYRQGMFSAALALAALTHLISFPSPVSSLSETAASGF